MNDATKRDQFPSGSGPRPTTKPNDPRQPVPGARRAEAVQGERRRRKDSDPDTASMKLYVPKSAKDPNFEYRYLLDNPGRIHAMTKEDDWDLVSTADLKGEVDPSLQAEDGTRVARFAERNGTASGGPRKMYLARKRKELHQQDRREKFEAMKDREDAMKRSPEPVAGGLKGSTAYIPNRHGEGSFSDGPGENSIERG